MPDRKAFSPEQRRQRNRNEVIEAIVEAARQTMREQGAAALNLNEIARALGMKTPSLYEYFPNKMALYDYLFRVGTRDLRARMAEVAVSVTPSAWDSVEQFLTAYIQWAIENPDFFKLLFERHIPGFTPSDESMAEMYLVLEEGRQQLQAILSAARLDPGISVQQAFDVFLVLQHGITALHLANSPNLPIGQGRFTILISFVTDMMKTAWQRQPERS